VEWRINPLFRLCKNFQTCSSLSFYSLAWLARTSVAGVRPGSRATFVRAKVAKTRDALLATSQRADASLRRAAQLAGLGQGLPVDESIRPRGQAAGVRQPAREAQGCGVFSIALHRWNEVGPCLQECIGMGMSIVVASLSSPVQKLFAEC